MKNKIISIFAILTLSLFPAAPTFAEEESTDSFSISPMYQRITLIPGERYTGSIIVLNPFKSTKNLHYSASVSPYTPVGDEYDPDFSTSSESTEITKWITFENPEGDLAPNEEEKVKFTIDVPEDSPAGGQYAAIMIENVPDHGNDSAGEGLVIESTIRMASILYATVMGDTVESGDIITNSFPSFVTELPVDGLVSFRNTGNVHLDATTFTQVFPLFSREEIYTNEESPMENLIMPNTTRSIVTKWEDAPTVGIFHIIQTTKFAEKSSIVDKYLFICPIWLLAVIAFIIILPIILVFTGHKRKQRHAKQSIED